jgi:hypothetical protein
MQVGRAALDHFLEQDAKIQRLRADGGRRWSGS